MKIVLNMIVRNCADYITKALDSVTDEVDVFVIGFGGESKDGTEKIVETWLRAAKKDFQLIKIKWEDDFAKARMAVLEATKKFYPDATHMFWLDADDTLVTRKSLKEIIAHSEGAGTIQFEYNYQFGEDGQLIVHHSRERIIDLKYDWRWVRPVHETLTTLTEHKVIYSDLAWIDHNAEATALVRSERNRKILEKQLVDDPEDRRTTLYLGHSYYSAQEYDKGRFWFAEYYNTPENPLEKWSAAVFAGRCSIALNEFEEGIGWFYHALDVRPEWADSYLGLAQCHTRLGNYDAAIEWYKQADNKAKPPSVLFIIENEYTWNRYAYEHEALAKTGNIRGAIEVVNKALQINPTHEGFIFYKWGYAESIASEEMLKAYEMICLNLLRRGDALKAIRLLDSCSPAHLEEEPKLQELRKFIISSVEQLWDKDIMAYFLKAGNYIGHEIDKDVPKDITGKQCVYMSRVVAVAELLEPHVARAKALGRPLRVLDIASAGGSVSSYLADRYDLELIGVEQDSDSVDAANKRAKDWELKNVEFHVVEDILTLDTEKLGKFDVVLVQEILEHTDKPGMIMMEAAELAEVIILSVPDQKVVTPNPGDMRNPKSGQPLYGHVIEYSRRDIEKLIGITGYSIENMYSVFDEQSKIPGYGNKVVEIRDNKRPLLPVVFYLGKTGGEAWSPKSINDVGLGGSETAAIKMAEEFAYLGHPTVVYCGLDAVHSGVVYKNISKFNSAGPYLGSRAWMFISSRIPDIADVPINADVKMLWVHDIHFRFPVIGGVVDRLTEDRGKQFDYILALSKWHKKLLIELYPWAKDKIVVTHNAITPENFKGAKKAEKVPHSFIYASSLDRGLERILNLWPDIRKMWKDATLDIFYGLDVMQKVDGHVPKVQEFIATIEKLSDQPGITFKGRIGQKELAQEFMKHKFWFYPSGFEETFCITALEAQAAGCIPLTTSVAALAERVPKEYRVDWKNGKEMLTALKKLDTKSRGTNKMIENALSFTWDKPVKQWLKLTVDAVKAKKEPKPQDQPIEEKPELIGV